MKKIMKLEKKIGYTFTNKDYLKEALLHSSYKNEHKEEVLNHNERLEFFGDAVLSFVISEYLYTHVDLPEGDLTRMRANIVCEDTLSKAARRLDLGAYLFFGKGELATGGHERASILADAYEAVLGAIYLDQGMEKVKAFILQDLKQFIDLAIRGKIFSDYKTALQEKLQEQGASKINYQVVKAIGPDHNKTFTTDVFNDGVKLGRGTGKSKKEAEQEAARAALEELS